MWTDFAQDVSYALRRLRQAPGFTVLALLMLALGIGANTAIFSAIDTALLRPLSYTDPDQLVLVWNTHDGRNDNLGPGRMLDLQREATSFSGFAGIAHISYTLTGAGEADRIAGSSVSSSFFDVLGARPFLGEPFHTGAADPSAVVLSYALWNRRFGSDPSIVGRTIVLNGRPRLVVAVMRSDFFWPAIVAQPGVPEGPQLWVPGGRGDVPRSATDEDRDMTRDRDTGYLRAVARLKPGVTVEQARAEMASIGDRLSREYPEDGGRSATAESLRAHFFGPVRRPLFVLAGVVALVLAIACANVAGLLLGRGAARRRELAVRRALGATRARVTRQLLTEALTLSAAGAILGIALARWSVSVLTALAPADFIGQQPIAIDARVLLFAVGVSIAAAIVFGTVPALQLSRDHLGGALGESGARSSGTRRAGLTRDVLVALEIGTAVVLLVGSALLVESLRTLTRVDVGLDTHNLLTFDINPTGDRARDPDKLVLFYDALRQRFSRVPGVRAVGGAVTLPIGGDAFGITYLPQDKPFVDVRSLPRAGFQVVTPGYFSAMAIPLKAGRDIEASDTRQSEPIVLVNDRLAREAWPGGDPIGKHLKFSPNDAAWMRVVGVVADIRHLGPGVPPRPEVYQPYSQRTFPFMAVVVRTASDPHAVMPSLRRAAAELDPTLPLANARTMEEHVERSLARPTFFSSLVTVFALLAVALALVGMYAMMAWSVSERQREFAIRVALGVPRSELSALVLRKGVALAAIGIGGGLAAARLLTGVLRGLLYGVTPTDPYVFVLAACAIALVVAAACSIPARRAARVDPAALLR